MAFNLFNATFFGGFKDGTRVAVPSALPHLLFEVVPKMPIRLGGAIGPAEILDYVLVAEDCFELAYVLSGAGGGRHYRGGFTGTPKHGQTEEEFRDDRLRWLAAELGTLPKGWEYQARPVCDTPHTYDVVPVFCELATA